ncbi:unnamed protein product, partial [Protopolystoma xenopodis]
MQTISIRTQSTQKPLSSPGGPSVKLPSSAAATGSSGSLVAGSKRPAPDVASPGSSAAPGNNSGTNSSAGGGTADAAGSIQVPLCLRKLVRSIVRSFYAREHSLIVDMLVRNTIMKEDDLCERLRFERKQLRQYLHTLKSDQFIKSRLQLETDIDGKTAKITHYYIDYK